MYNTKKKSHGRLKPRLFKKLFYIMHIVDACWCIYRESKFMGNLLRVAYDAFEVNPGC